MGNMNDCRKIQKRLAALAPGEADGGDDEALERHLGRCPECRRSRDEIRRIAEGAGRVREDLSAAMTDIDWNAHAERIADAAFCGPRPLPARRPSAGRTLFVPRFRPAMAGLLAGIILGAGGEFLVLSRRPSVQVAGTKVVASRDFIDRVEYQMARRDTLDYLDKSQYLLLDFVQAAPGRARLLEQGPDAGPVRDMLSKKRLINGQLDSVRMSKAREICNQIEVLFLELSAVSGELSEAEAARIKDYIEQKQLLLKIELLKKELQDNEV
jgi:hypothetical protein